VRRAEFIDGDGISLFLDPERSVEDFVVVAEVTVVPVDKEVICDMDEGVP
jgi:hypothetical protein